MVHIPLGILFIYKQLLKGKKTQYNRAEKVLAKNAIMQLCRAEEEEEVIEFFVGLIT